MSRLHQKGPFICARIGRGRDRVALVGAYGWCLEIHRRGAIGFHGLNRSERALSVVLAWCDYRLKDRS
jgi:hypothetical protein